MAEAMKEKIDYRALAIADIPSYLENMAALCNASEITDYSRGAVLILTGY